MRAATLTLAVLLSVLCVSVASCASNNAAQSVGGVATTQPATDAQQISGTIAAGIKSTLELAGIKGNATGYNSEFGVGATLVVSLTLVLTIFLSHLREVARIKAGK